MIKRADLDARIAVLKRFIAMASKKQKGVRYNRLRFLLEGYVAQAEQERGGPDVTTDLVIFSRMVGIAIGCGIISEGQCIIIDQTYANKSNPAGP